LRTVVEDREKIEEIGSMARTWALKEFSAERFIMQHVSLYLTFLKRADAPELKNQSADS
jgi:hypothetical protein